MKILDKTHYYPCKNQHAVSGWILFFIFVLEQIEKNQLQERNQNTTVPWESAPVYMFDKVFASFSLLTCTIDTHVLEVDTYCNLWRKKHTSIDTLEIEMTCITRQPEYFKLQLKYLENITHNILSLKNLDALMQVSLCGLEVYAMDWVATFNIWRNMWDRRIHTLDWWVFFWFCYKSKLHISKCWFP